MGIIQTVSQRAWIFTLVPTLNGSLGVWRSPVARFVRDEEVVGSNPATPTRVVLTSRVKRPVLFYSEDDKYFTQAKTPYMSSIASA